MKKILYADISSGFGGSSIVLYDLLANLDRQKFEPVVVVHRDGPNFEKLKGLNIKVIKKDLKAIGLMATDAKSSYGVLFFDLIFHFLPNAFTLCDCSSSVMSITSYSC